MTDLLNIGAGALKAYQTSIATTGHNISNADVDGYSRQRVELTTQPGTDFGVGFIGNGVTVEDIARIVDDSVVRQLRLDTSNFNELDAFVSQIDQLDRILADSSTGLSTGFESFFAAMQQGANDPTSIPVRSLIISEAEALTDRFNTISTRFKDFNDAINTQLAASAKQVNSYAKAIASINQQILNVSKPGVGQQPNDLLDQREKLLQGLSELVSVNVIQEDNGTVNVLIGNGQPLVVGSVSAEIQVQDGENDPQRKDVIVIAGNSVQPITKSITGGTLGGLIDYRETVLDESINSIGRIALAFNDAVNTLQRQGIDLNGQFGADLFQDINDPAFTYERVTANRFNSEPNDAVISVDITDVSQLTKSDYLLEFPGPGTSRYTLTRQSDGVVVKEGPFSGLYPFRIQHAGFQISLESGTFNKGDAFLIQPTRNGADDINMVLNSERELAFALPIAAQASLSNNGSATISQGELYSTTGITDTALSSFAAPGELSPPLLVRFTSPTTYDVYDNSDPANPVPLDPPIRNRSYAAGANNQIFPNDSNARISTSEGPAVQTANIGAIGLADNGYTGETLTTRQTNLDTGEVTLDTRVIPAGSSAREIAASLNTINGVTAYANTEAVFTVDDAGGLPLQVQLNGEDLLGVGFTGPTTADYLRDQINNNSNLQAAGIVALSDGTNLTIRSLYGDDLDIQVPATADAADSLDFVSINGFANAATIDQGQEAIIQGQVDTVIENSGTISSDSGVLFEVFPQSSLAFTGFQFQISGVAEAGDEFLIDFNAGGISDNRNALALVALQTADILEDGGVSINEEYGSVVESIGTKANKAHINREAAEVLKNQSQLTREGISGVNLDEEAANLIQFEQAYNAAAQIISIARTIFDSLITAVS